MARGRGNQQHWRSDNAKANLQNSKGLGALATELSPPKLSLNAKDKYYGVFKTRRRMARERRGAGSSLVSMETPYYKTIY